MQFFWKAKPYEKKHIFLVEVKWGHDVVFAYTVYERHLLAHPKVLRNSMVRTMGTKVETQGHGWRVFWTPNFDSGQLPYVFPRKNNTPIWNDGKHIERLADSQICGVFDHEVFPEAIRDP